MKKKTEAKKFRVVAIYPGGLSKEKDEALFQLAKPIMGGTGMSSGSGFCFFSGERDNEWIVYMAGDASALKTLLMRAQIDKLKVDIYEVE